MRRHRQTLRLPVKWRTNNTKFCACCRRWQLSYSLLVSPILPTLPTVLPTPFYCVLPYSTLPYSTLLCIALLYSTLLYCTVLWCALLLFKIGMSDFSQTNWTTNYLDKSNIKHVEPQCWNRGLVTQLAEPGAFVPPSSVSARWAVVTGGNKLAPSEFRVFGFRVPPMSWACVKRC